MAGGTYLIDASGKLIVDATDGKADVCEACCGECDCPTECTPLGADSACYEVFKWVEITGFLSACCDFMNGFHYLYPHPDPAIECKWVGEIATGAPDYASAVFLLECTVDGWLFTLTMNSAVVGCGDADQQVYEGYIDCTNSCGCGTFTLTKTGGDNNCSGDDEITAQTCVDHVTTTNHATSTTTSTTTTA